VTALRRPTPDEIAHGHAERRAKGLPENISDPEVLARIARVVVRSVRATNSRRRRAPR